MRPPTLAGLAALPGLLALALFGCARGAGLPPLVLRPEPIPYADTLPIHEPEYRAPGEIGPLLRESTVGELGQPLDPDDWIYRNEALNLTHFDDVVSSAWFEHRITRRELSRDDVLLGPTSRERAPKPPYVVTRLKSAGISPGLWVEDAKGDVYLFKFDPPQNLYLSSSANAIGSRLFWAAGFHVPEDYLVSLDTTSLRLSRESDAPSAEDIRGILGRTASMEDGRYRAIASKLLPGQPKGPFRFRGTREDDPNDHYLHQNRRELRALYVLSAWTNHVDMRFANTMDVWIDPPGYLRHYLQDFGATLGSGTIRPHNPREGVEYNFDIWAFLARLPTFGFYKTGWEDQSFEVIDPAIGWMPVETYEPGAWKPNWPNAAFRAVTAADGYWGAKIVSRFSDELIRAAVEAGELPNRRAADTMTAILRVRRDRTVRYWFDRVSPIERVIVECTDGSGGGLSVTFEDLAILTGTRTRIDTRYEWEFEDEARGRRWEGTSEPSSSGRQRIRVTPADAPAGCPADASGERDPPNMERAASERPASLRIRAERLEPGAGPQPRPARVSLRWMGEALGYAVIGLEH